MAANNTVDAVRAAEFWLYFPNQRLQQHLEQYEVPLMYFYYTAPQEANTWVNIDSVMQLKLEASAKHVSQFEPSVKKYRPDWDPKDLAKMQKELTGMQTKKDGHYVEVFRKAAGFNQE
jgi:LmbE family N-acetylglucosaminyl deacetylase